MKKKLTYKEKLQVYLDNATGVDKQMIELHPCLLNWKNYERKSIDMLYQKTLVKLT